eukprot:760796-Hanusia_phi.AAC.1
MSCLCPEVLLSREASFSSRAASASGSSGCREGKPLRSLGDCRNSRVHCGRSYHQHCDQAAGVDKEGDGEDPWRACSQYPSHRSGGVSGVGRALGEPCRHLVPAGHVYRIQHLPRCVLHCHRRGAVSHAQLCGDEEKGLQPLRVLRPLQLDVVLPAGPGESLAACDGLTSCCQFKDFARMAPLLIFAQGAMMTAMGEEWW